MKQIIQAASMDDLHDNRVKSAHQQLEKLNQYYQEKVETQDPACKQNLSIHLEPIRTIGSRSSTTAGTDCCCSSEQIELAGVLIVCT